MESSHIMHTDKHIDNFPIHHKYRAYLTNAHPNE